MTKRSAALVLSALALSVGGGLVGQSRAEAVHDRVVFADIHAHPSRFHRANVDRIDNDESSDIAAD